MANIFHIERIDNKITLGTTGTTINIASHTASRLLSLDASKNLISVTNLATWIAGTTNRVTVADDGDGTITLSGPQDFHTGANPTFADLTLSTPSNIYALSHDSFAGFVADEHVAHSGVTLTAGTGLTGGGDISANRTFAVDGVLEDLDTLGANSADSEFLVGTGAGILAWESGATARTSLGVDAAGTAAGLIATHESTYNHSNYNTAYTHSQLTSSNPHNVTPAELSLVIGTNVQAWDVGLDSLAALTYASDSFIKVTATDTYAIRTIAETKSDLGLDLVENTALSTWVGTSSITTVGTLTSGTIGAGFTEIGTAYTAAKCTDATADNTAANETSHTNVLIDGDFGSAGVMYTDGAGGYSLKAIGTDVQAYHANLAAIAGATWTGAASITTLGTIGTVGAITGQSTAAFEGASITVGKASTTTGTIVLHDSNSANTITLTVPDISAGSLSFTLPPTDGDNTNVLQTDGNGVLTWVAAGAGGDPEGDKPIVVDSDTNTLAAAHAYKAQTLGTVTAWIPNTSGAIRGYVADQTEFDVGGHPATDGTLTIMSHVIGTDVDPSISFTVAKDHYFEVTVSSGTPVIVWTPSIASGAAPIDQD